MATTPGPRLKVVVTRKWTQPSIEAYIHSEAVGARMELTAFVDALASEIDKPCLIFTHEQLRAKLQAACTSVLAEMKDTTKYVV